MQAALHAVFLAAASIVALGSLSCGAEEELPPGFLVVTVDSLRADFLSCYGGLPGVGERMCSLEQEGTRFVWAFSPASSSAPAIASILTSRYPTDHGVDASAASFLPDGETTLAEALRDAGYATAAFVSSPELNRSRNLHQGFQVYDDQTERSAAGRLPTRTAEATTTAALAWLEETRAPWLLWVHFREPHGPYAAAPTPADEARGSEASERLRVLATPRGRGGIPSYQALPGLFTRGAYEARYRAEIRAVDAQVGRLLAAVAGRPEPVGVAITADHGEAFGEDRYFLSHGHSVSPDQVRVPLFWRPPTGTRPESLRVVVSTLDLMPTILRAAGLGPPEGIEGWVLPSPQDPPGAPEQARAVFAIHPDRVAVASGSNFYSRSRESPGAPGAPPSAAFLERTLARTAPLSPDGSPPRPEPARPTGITPLLEPRVREFLGPDSEAIFLESGTAVPSAEPLPQEPAEALQGEATSS